jgi:hypothetical protein
MIFSDILAEIELCHESVSKPQGEAKIGGHSEAGDLTVPEGWLGLGGEHGAGYFKGSMGSRPWPLMALAQRLCSSACLADAQSRTSFI